MKEKTFIVRIEEKTLNDFNDILKENSVNRSELFRNWIRKYIENERGKTHGIKQGSNTSTTK